jgi:hypothetical protein
MSKPLTEKETRAHLLDHARQNGYEQPIIDIFRKIDEAMKHAKTKYEREYISVQGLQEIDAYFNGGQSSLNDTLIRNIDQATINKFNKR